MIGAGDAALQPFQDRWLPELMGWFPDAEACRIWGGPEFRFPCTAATFREDSRVDDLPTWALVRDDGRFVAFGQYYPRIGHCHLGRLAVAPDLRGRGLGGRLVRDLCRQGASALGLTSFSLFVMPGNERALRLYQRLGFSAVPYPEPSPRFAEAIYMVAPAIAR